MSAPFVGKTVRICGIGSKPQLNGVLGVCSSFDAGKCRYTVKTHEGQTLALKAANLELVAGAESAGAGGGAGAAAMMAAAQQTLARLRAQWVGVLASLPFALPAGVTPDHAAAGAAVLCLALFYVLGARTLMLGGLVLYGGTSTDAGRRGVTKISQSLSGALARPVPERAVLAAAVGACVVLPLLMGAMGGGGGVPVPNSAGGGSAGPASSSGWAGHDEELVALAYRRGHEDGATGKPQSVPRISALNAELYNDEDGAGAGMTLWRLGTANGQTSWNKDTLIMGFQTMPTYQKVLTGVMFISMFAM